MPLVIVESPTKSKTISKFLEPEYKVISCYGHIRDLPKRDFGIDIENNFTPKYIIIPRSKKIISSLKKEVKKTDLCLISTDPDREGEAIAWHLTKVLNLNENNYQRIVFHEITKEAIKEALKNPRKIDNDLVDSQQARRILDRIVGYKLSPFLWKKVARGLSAGRVQSVAVRLVVEREREREKFIPQEYWTIEGLFKKSEDISNKNVKAVLEKKEGKKINKFDIKTKSEANQILKDLKEAEYKIEKIERKETKRNPLPPFTTSTLQQTSWQRFGWQAKLTMTIAQQLYEKGFITYHRTDSLNLSNLALVSAKKFILQEFGEKYYQFRKYKTRSKNAQEAHEAIRPTNVKNIPNKVSNLLDRRQLKLYELIWQRFIACQMTQAVFNSITAEIKAKKYTFKTTGQTLKFDGFLKVYPLKYEEKELPNLEVGENLELIKLKSLQHFTEPPPRYTEATLIKTLEENSIGRPSTYAIILSNIQERNYIEKDEQKRLKPTEIGIVVNDLLVNHFPEIVDIEFTAKMENNLDEIAQGKKEWTPLIKDFYNRFYENLKKKYKEISKKDISQELTQEKCPKCGSQIIIRLGKFGKFYSCSNFPKCKYTESLKENNLNIKCPKCNKGKIIEKRTKKNKIFYGCSQYPNCDFALWEKPLKERCPKCSHLLVETKRGKIKCSNKNCDYFIEK